MKVLMIAPEPFFEPREAPTSANQTGACQHPQAQ